MFFMFLFFSSSGSTSSNRDAGSTCPAPPLAAGPQEYQLSGVPPPVVSGGGFTGILGDIVPV